jgi:hypothetical protein
LEPGEPQRDNACGYFVLVAATLWSGDHGSEAEFHPPAARVRLKAKK